MARFPEMLRVDNNDRETLWHETSKQGLANANEYYHQNTPKDYMRCPTPHWSWKIHRKENNYLLDKSYVWKIEQYTGGHFDSEKMKTAGRT